MQVYYVKSYPNESFDNLYNRFFLCIVRGKKSFLFKDTFGHLFGWMIFILSFLCILYMQFSPYNENGIFKYQRLQNLIYLKLLYR